MGISTSRLCDRRAYRGRIDGEYRMRASSGASRSRTRGWRTATGPMPVMISRSGRWPRRTERCWPVSVTVSPWRAPKMTGATLTCWPERTGQPVDLVDGDDVDPASLDVGEQTLQCRPLDVATREPAIVVTGSGHCPALVTLTADVG